MIDIALNSDFSVELDDRNDLAVVEGRDAFEQAVAVRLTDVVHEQLPGFTDRDAAAKRLRMAVHRVARDYGWIDSVASVEIEPKPGEPNTLTVEVVYDVGDSFKTEVREA